MIQPYGCNSVVNVGFPIKISGRFDGVPEIRFVQIFNRWVYFYVYFFYVCVFVFFMYCLLCVLMVPCGLIFK